MSKSQVPELHRPPVPDAPGMSKRLNTRLRVKTCLYSAKMRLRALVHRQDLTRDSYKDREGLIRVQRLMPKNG